MIFNVKQKPIIVVGPGRCGTSTTVRVLQNEFGINMGFKKNSREEDLAVKFLVDSFIDGKVVFQEWLSLLLEYLNAREALGKRWGFKYPRAVAILGLFLSYIEDVYIVRCRRDLDSMIASHLREYSWLTEESAKDMITGRELILDRLLIGRPNVVEIDFTNRLTEGEIKDKISLLSFEWEHIVSW